MSNPPDWPVIDYAIAPNFGPADDPNIDPNQWVFVTGRTEGQTAITRGKQYELDQIQPGQMTFTLRNDDGAFDPGNSAGPFASQLVPYRLCRVRAQYPASANLMLQDQATAWFTSQGAVTTTTLPPGVHAEIGGLSVAPKDGTTNQYVVNAGVPAGFAVVTFRGLPFIPGQAYSGQIKFTAATSSDYHIDIVWSDGTVVTGATVTGTSGTCTVSGVAPAGAWSVSLRLSAGAVTNSALPSFFNPQWEQAAAPSTWVAPSPWYSLFTGYVERWPQSWDDDGNYGTSALTAIDRFTWMANRGLGWPAYLELLALNPRRFYALDEDSGAKTFADYLGVAPSAQVYTPRSGAFQTLTAGNQLVAGAGATVPLGIAGPVVTFTNAPSQTAAQLIDLTCGGQTGAPATYTRVFAFRAPNTPALANKINVSLLYTQAKSVYAAASYLTVAGSYDSGGNLTTFGAYIMNQGLQVAASTNITANLSDGNWHLVTVAVTGNTLSFWFDGVPVTVSNTGTFPALNGGTDVLGGQLSPATLKSTPGAAVDLAMFAEYNVVLTNTQVANLYQAFEYAWGSQSPTHTETSDARYQRLLNWAGVTGTPRIASGASVDYGPATDLSGGTSPTMLLAALQNVVDTEAGQHFIAGDGAVVFQSRRNRYNTTPIVTFGENGGEIPYTGASTDFDPTLVANDVTTTAQYGGAATATSYRVTDATSGNNYGDLTLTRTVNTLDGGELQSAAQYLLYQNKQPLLRFEALPVDLGANPTLWGSVLPRELGDPVTVNRRPSNAPAIAMSGFLEQVQWQIGDDRTASWTAQVSNSALHQFGAFDSAVYGKFDSTLIFGY